MNTLIHIEIAASMNHSYSHEIVEWSKQHLPKVVTFDFDNYSEPAIADYANDLVKQSNAVSVIINIKDSQHTGSVRKFLDQLLRQQAKVNHIILNGDHPLIKQMCQPFKDKFRENKSLDEQKQLLNSAFNHQHVA